MHQDFIHNGLRVCLSILVKYVHQDKTTNHKDIHPFSIVDSFGFFFNDYTQDFLEIYEPSLDTS